MKLQNIFRLQKLYYLFFLRQVLSVGVLKEKLFRILFVGLAMGLLIMTFIFNYNLFDDSLVLPEIDWLSSLTRGRAIQVVTWTITAFIMIKLLFLKKGSFLKMTAQLPITNQERHLSLLVFELLMVLLLVILVSSSFAVAFFLRFGITSTMLLLSGSLFTCLTLYLMLQLGEAI